MRTVVVGRQLNVVPAVELLAKLQARDVMTYSLQNQRVGVRPTTGKVFKHCDVIEDELTLQLPQFKITRWMVDVMGGRRSRSSCDVMRVMSTYLFDSLFGASYSENAF